MKKAIILLFSLLIPSFSLPTLAGDVPESLISQGDIFWAEVLSYDKSAEVITVLPTIIIKGNPDYEAERTYYRAMPVGTAIRLGKAYLMTYYDENNPLYIFETTSFDTDTLKLKGVKEDEHTMWGRFQTYLNEGRYGRAGVARGDIQPNNPDDIAIENPGFQDIVPISDELPIDARANNWALYLLIGPAAIILTYLIILWRRKKK
ncbi:MAG: hypothetical protein FWE47_03950 [Oscillospiraceae bacterium]|nr:hypothetical protein [Oscillospiraceae bacterium]